MSLNATEKAGNNCDCVKKTKQYSFQCSHSIYERKTKVIQKVVELYFTINIGNIQNRVLFSLMSLLTNLMNYGMYFDKIFGFLDSTI